MPTPRDLEALLDITKAGNLIVQFIHGMSQSAFNTDPKTQSAVSHQLLIVGEATKRLSQPFRSENSQIPWVLMAGMRNHLIHAYDMVDLDEVWQTASQDIPTLLIAIDTLLRKH